MNYYSPFSYLQNVYFPEGKGIYALPASTEAENGWGEPRATSDGQPIVPGTVGGPYPVARIHLAPPEKDKYGQVIESAKDTYEATANKAQQKAGNITWWGPWIDPKNEKKGRQVLSYHGPSLRYFREEIFKYGADDKHFEIYKDGQYAGVAPGPVLGAALAPVNIYNPEIEGPEPILCIIAIIRKGQNDQIWYRPPYYIKPDGMTDETRNIATRFYDANYPELPGWRFMGEVSYQENAYPPETPWFFSEDGRQASCMRRTKHEFFNGREMVKENRFDHYELALTGVSTEDIYEPVEIKFNNRQNLEPFTYKETYTKDYRLFDYVVDGDTLVAREDHLIGLIEMNGEQYVACDYLENRLYMACHALDVLRIQEHFWVEDAKSEEPCPVPKPVDYVPAPGDGYCTTWIGTHERIYLTWGTKDYPYEFSYRLYIHRTGNSDEWEGLEPQEDNPYHYFEARRTNYPMGFCDLRKFRLLTFEDEEYRLGPDEIYNTNKLDVFYKDKLLDTSDEYRVELTKQKAQLAFTEWVIGWDHEKMKQEWEEEFNYKIEVTSYEGGWPAYNFTETENRFPTTMEFYQQDYMQTMRTTPWPTIDELYNAVDKTECTGNGVSSDINEDWCFSVKIPVRVSDDNEKQFLYKSRHSQYGDDDLGSVFGYGTWFYPIQSC